MDENKKRENFKKIAERRTNEILDKINSFRNFTNTSFYSYTDEEIDKILKYINGAIKQSIEPLKERNKNKKKWKLEEDK